MRRVFCLILSCLLVIIMLPSSSKEVFAITKEDFEGNEDYYYELCSKSGLSASEKEVCRLFSDYLTEKAEEIQDDVKDIQQDINEIKKDLNKVISKINSLQNQIEKLNKQISELQKQIAEKNANIAALQVEIDERIANIERIDNQIKERMVSMQPYVSMNTYIEFLMGATDFADLLRRISALDEIMTYDTDMMKLLEEEKRILDLKQDELEEQKASLEGSKEVLEDTKQTVKKALAIQEDLKAEFLSKEAELEEKKRESEDVLEGIKDQIEEIADAIGYIAPSVGWIYPIKGKFSISAGAFYYPKSFGGGVHLGVDFAASTSKYDVAVANGVIAWVYDKCATYGKYGYWGGSPAGAGNNVLLICQVADRTYGVSYCHMSKGVSNYVKVGDIVTQGQILGHVGSSGNSTGPHTHVEVYDLGTIGIQAALKLFARKSFPFGMGWAIGSRCSVKKTPCRLNPQDIFKVKYGNSYKG